MGAEKIVDCKAFIWEVEMIPEGKAKEILDKFHNILAGIDTHEDMNEEIKQCSITVVDEVIAACEYNHCDVWNTEWWKKVKNTIDKSS